MLKLLVFCGCPWLATPPGSLGTECARPRHSPSPCTARALARCPLLPASQDQGSLRRTGSPAASGLSARPPYPLGPKAGRARAGDQQHCAGSPASPAQASVVPLSYNTVLASAGDRGRNGAPASSSQSFGTWDGALRTLPLDEFWQVLPIPELSRRQVQPGTALLFVHAPRKQGHFVACYTIPAPAAERSRAPTRPALEARPRVLPHAAHLGKARRRPPGGLQTSPALCTAAQTRGREKLLGWPPVSLIVLGLRCEEVAFLRALLKSQNEPQRVRCLWNPTAAS